MPSGELDKRDANGDGIIYYPSGRFAVMVCKQGGGRVITVTADSDKGEILLHFNQLGVGTISYASGKPWVVAGDDSFSVSDRKGLIVERGRYPRKQGAPVVCEVNECLSVTFQDKHSVVAKFRCEDAVHTFEVGQQLRRKVPYTEKSVVGKAVNGKLELDVAGIRERQVTVGGSGSLYVPPGPHHLKTDRPGLGELKATLRVFPADCGVASMVSDLQAMDARIGSISLMPKPSFGASSTLKSTAGAGTGAAGMTSTSRSVPDDYGSPCFSETMRSLAKEVRPLNPKHQMHKVKRAALPRMRMADVSRLASGPDAPSDTLVVLVLMADWSPACVKLEPAVQVTNGELLSEASAVPDCPSSKVCIYKVDASEGATLQKQYDFRTVPMYLSYYQGKLTAAGNDFGSSGEFKASCLESLARARKGVFLPSTFSFRGIDNLQLDYIKPTMSLVK